MFFCCSVFNVFYYYYYLKQTLILEDNLDYKIYHILSSPEQVLVKIHAPAVD